MAQINFTLNQEEILQLLKDNQGEAFRKMLMATLNEVMLVESELQLGAKPYERTEERTDSRNGYYDRELTTRMGTITLHVPRHRNEPFKTLLFDNYSTSEAALISTMAEMVVNGVATRKVGKVMETLCGREFSKSTVSEVCKELDKQVQPYQNKPLTEEYPFVVLDATYFKVREEHKIISKAMYIAFATNAAGQRDILGFRTYPCETKEYWKDFLDWLKEKGLSGVRVFTSDAHEGIRYAIGRVYPTVPWQRCQFHFARDILDKVPKKYKVGLSGQLTDMFNCKTTKEARKMMNELIGEYSDIAESAMKCLEGGFENAMTVMVLPEAVRRECRTSNHIERLNKELKRRSNVIGIFPNEASLIRLIGAVLMEHNMKIQDRVHPVFYKTTYAELCKCDMVLRKIAEEQLGMMVA